ncbi:dietary restriction over expressed [Caenorhabditis elegans]|uniref:Dietary restriction over expressed n=1 Tax=Caenorhabditis elegans TaxID=6239 RepID=A0A0K3AT53_CAEEL|nr:dietary restriction over expressed [Caenorhabditis elegans]CTQ86994.1 dietary restriction over expressed [Caenorhabditis elegans]|eukprot:NP_001300295.1 dietary restriction over expressed [Caenorhabditis elegans]
MSTPKRCHPFLSKNSGEMLKIRQGTHEIRSEPVQFSNQPPVNPPVNTQVGFFRNTDGIPKHKNRPVMPNSSFPTRCVTYVDVLNLKPQVQLKKMEFKKESLPPMNNPSKPREDPVVPEILKKTSSGIKSVQHVSQKDKLHSETNEGVQPDIAPLDDVHRPVVELTQYLGSNSTEKPDVTIAKNLEPSKITKIVNEETKPDDQIQQISHLDVTAKEDVDSSIELENEDNCQIDDDIKNTSEVRKEITKFEETVAVPDENEQSFVNSSNFVDPNCEKETSNEDQNQQNDVVAEETMEKPGNLTRSFLTENNRLLIEEACLDGIEHSNIVAEIREDEKTDEVAWEDLNAKEKTDDENQTNDNLPEKQLTNSAEVPPLCPDDADPPAELSSLSEIIIQANYLPNDGSSNGEKSEDRDMPI